MYEFEKIGSEENENSDPLEIKFEQPISKVLASTFRSFISVDGYWGYE